MKDKIVTFGEIMLRLSPENNARFTQCNAFEAVYGGGEANVAVSLAGFGHDAQFVTAVPDNEIGECALATLRKYQVGTKYVAKEGEPFPSFYYVKIHNINLLEVEEA